MSDRKGSYMRPGRRVTSPGVVFTMHIDTVNRMSGGKGLAVTKRFARAVVTRSIYRRGQWDRVKIGHCDTIESVREWMSQHSLPGRTNWVVPADASSALTLLSWWEHAEQVGIKQIDRKSRGKEGGSVRQGVAGIALENLCVRTGTTIVTYHQSGVRWRWVSAAQFDPSGLGYEVRPAGPGGAAGVGGGADGHAHSSTAEARAVALSVWFRGLCDFWRRTARSSFGTTIGQLAVGMLRSHVAPKSLCSHSLDEAHLLERAAAFGGRASVWYVGDIGDGSGYPDADAASGADVRRPRIDGPVTHVDVRSMYPTLLRDKIYPVKLKSVHENVPVADLLDYSRHMCTIARVTVASEFAEYPARAGERVAYPVGRFLTTLTGPEIIRLASEGDIITCHEMSLYNSGTPFAGAAAAMLGFRDAARADGRRSDEDFAKLLSNSLGGKLAQRSGGWCRWADEDAPGRWGEEWRYDMRTNTRLRCRYLAGMCWTWVDDKMGKGPYTFAFAYLTAYGRLMMRDLRDSLPPRTVVSQDTDGLWLLPAGLDALCCAVDHERDGPGALRVTARAADARFWGPRHYVAGGKWTLAGFSSPVVLDDGVTVRDQFDGSIWSQRNGTAPSETQTSRRESKLQLQDVGGTVGPDGWVTPRRAGRSSLPPG